MLFDIKLGFSVDAILEYYLGNEEKFIAKKTWGGILKIILAHVFTFGLLSMVLLHFLIFTKFKHTKTLQKTIILLFLSGALEILSPFFIINGFIVFAYIKLVSLFVFEVILLTIFYLLFFSIRNE